MRRSVVPPRRIPPRGIDNAVHRVTNCELLQDCHLVDAHPPHGSLYIQHPRHRFPATLENAAVPDLAAGFGVERRSIQYDVGAAPSRNALKRLTVP